MYLSKSLKVLIFLFNLTWVLPLILIIKILKLFINIRLCGIRTDRIGHFVLDSAENKARVKKNFNQIQLFFFIGPISNKSWAKIVRRNLNIFQILKPLYTTIQKLKIAKNLIDSPSATGSRDIYGYYNKYNIEFKFNKDEINFARKWLINKNISLNKKFVCFLVRDQAYLKNTPIHKSNKHLWNNHNYRNSKIENYLSSMEWLTKQGYYVFRMGSIAEKRLKTKK